MKKAAAPGWVPPWCSIRVGRDSPSRRVEVSSPQGRFAEGAAALDGSLVEGSVDRVERFLLDRFPESCRVERTIASFADVTG